MRPRTYIRVPIHKPNQNRLSQLPNFSTITEGATTSSEHQIHAHLLSTCLQQCKQIQSRRLFNEMPERVIYASRLCKAIHAQSLRFGFVSKGKLGDAIVDLYAKCGNVELAEKAFGQLETCGTLAWNSVLSMYSRQGMLENVVQSFVSMQNCGVLPNQFTYAIVLSACARLVDVVFGKQVHGNLIKMGFEYDSFCEGSLIDMYAKCGVVFDARKIFYGVVDPDTVSWTAMIAGYAKATLLEEALNVFEKMKRQGQVPDQVAFATVISACIGLGRLDDACHLFAQMPSPNTVAWNVMISGHAQRGYELEALEFFHDMMQNGVKSTRSTLGSVLSAIASLADLNCGSNVHAHAIKQGLDSNVYVGSSLINMYAKCQKMDSASKLFDALEEKNVVLWNALLGGNAQNGYACDVVELFINMRDSGFQPDEYTYTSILSACGYLDIIDLGRQLHSLIVKEKFEANLFVGNALVDMYAKCRALDDALKQFDLLGKRDNVSWNAIIVGYVQKEQEDEAFSMFQRMRSNGISADEVSLASILSACANIHAHDEGEQAHCLLLKSGLDLSVYAGSSLIDMYAKCGAVTEARRVFSCMPNPSVVSTNALIAGYAQTHMKEAVKLFCYMLAHGLNPSEVTFGSLLDACGEPSKLSLGMQIHSLIVKSGFSYYDDFLAVSLLCMYMNSQRITDGIALFSEFPYPKTTIIWTAIISGYIQNDRSEDALLQYQEMQNYGAIPDQATFVSVLKACAMVASLPVGREIHSLIFHFGLDSDELTSSALIDMYAKCGDVDSSVHIFQEMVRRNEVISWNSMIVGFAKNGYVQNALEIFHELIKAQINPDEVTFLGVLTACSHGGRVAEGRLIFDLMINCYGIQPRTDHCACMIDILGRWGCLKEAEEFINRLESEPDAKIWATFLGACKMHGDETRGQLAAKKLIELEPQSSSPYVLLSNIYAASNNWECVNSVRLEMKQKGVQKFPGCSWIVVGQKTNLFVAGDKFHPSAGQIHAVLKDLVALMKDEGYVADIESYMCCED